MGFMNFPLQNTCLLDSRTCIFQKVVVIIMAALQLAVGVGG